MKTASIFILSLALLIVGVGTSACDRSDRVEAAREPDKLNDRAIVLTDDEKEFVKYASETHTGEMDMARLAKQKSSNEDVKNYADAVIDEHSGLLKQLSGKTGQNLTGTTGSLDTTYHVEYLSPLSGAKFDREFIALMIADHKDAAETFNTQLNTAQNSGLKDYLKDAAKTLEESLNEAQKVQSNLNAKSSK